jgi:predicted regulator of Ras-like GTPase activity (Roadblock/LC7/MglB family)
MQSSVFAKILETVVTALPGARGAVFVDWEGEMVDCYARVSDLAIRLVGAHWGIIFKQVKAIFEEHQHGTLQEVVLLLSGEQVVIRRVTDDYVAIIALEKGENLGKALSMMQRAGKMLLEEM